MRRLSEIAALIALLGLAACSGTGVGASGEPVRIGLNDRLVTGQSPAGTWATGAAGADFEPPGSLPPGAEGIGPRVKPEFHW